ncbi:MAG: PqqD family protein [Oscillospiraceae bacterium]|nr:PqqD family protein [Oscillospiraceae bacterium]
MKLKYEFVVREIMGEYVLVPSGEAALTFGGMITTSEVGAFLIDVLKDEVTKEEMADRLMAEYDVDIDTANADIDEFLSKLDQLGIIE